MSRTQGKKIHIATTPQRKLGSYYRSLCGRWEPLELFDRGEVMPTCQSCINSDKGAIARAIAENRRKQNAQDRRVRRKRVRRSYARRRNTRRTP